MDFYSDTLFVSCGMIFEGDSVNLAVKFIGEEYQTVCSGTAAMCSIQLQPNPGADRLWITGSSNETFSVHDVLGRCILSTSYIVPNAAIETGTWSAGIYLFTFTNDSGRKQVLRWVKE